MAQTTARPAEPASPYRWFALAILFVVGLFNYIDRSILVILQVPVKAELHLSDTQMGALTGLSFALIYTTMALPIARVADTVARTRVLTICLAIWSAMTGLSGLATGFAMLVVCRMGVALGEAGCVPSTLSLISDFFERRQRATAIALCGISAPVGTMLGMGVGGWLGHAVGWRHAFMGVGAVGLVLAPLTYLLLREPKRGQFDPPQVKADPPGSVKASLAILWKLKAFRYTAMAGALHAYAQYTMLNWNAPFYSRVHHLPISETAYYLALMNGLGGGIGTFAGGMLCDWAGRRDVRWYLRIPAIASALVVPAGLAQYFSVSPYVSLGIGFASSLLIYMYIAPIVATAHMLVSPKMRAFTSAVLMLTINLLGLGLGPLATGAISDRLVAQFGMQSDSLRYAISHSLLACAVAAVLFWIAAGYLRADVARTETD